MQTLPPLHELRLVFTADGDERRFAPFLGDADYENLCWYIDDYMDLPNGGAGVRAAAVEADLAEWGRRLHEAILSAPETDAALQRLLAAPEQLSVAVSRYRHALQRFQAADDRAGMMQTYKLLGVVEQDEGRLAEPSAWYEKSWQLAVDLNHQRWLGAAALNLGVVCQREGEAAREQGDEPAVQIKFEAALAFVEASLRIWQALGDKPGEATSLSQPAIIDLRVGDLPAAEWS